jgi:oxalate decarboxylase/phosphoglucose isomerase-like protein (cupin superfamily)
MNTIGTPGIVTTRESPGVAYDPVADRIVVWHGGAQVWALNMDTGVWSQVATGPGPASVPPYQGTFGRWGYVPRYRVHVLINDIDENAWVFRLTP